MTPGAITSLILIFLSLYSCVRSQHFTLNSFKILIYPLETLLPGSYTPKLCYFIENYCFFTTFPHPVHSTSGYLNENFHERNKRQLNLMNYNYTTPAVKFGKHKTEKWMQSVIHGKIWDQKLQQHPNIHVTDKSPINSIIYNNVISDGILGRGNPNALSKNIQLLQSINNPIIYEVIRKPITDVLVPTRSPTKYPFTRRTGSPMTALESYPYKNYSNITPKSVNMSPTSKYEQWNSKMYNNYEAMVKFMQALDQFERKFYKVTFTKLSSISPLERRENGISFVQSGLFLQLALMALSSEVDADTKREIDECIGLELSNTEKIYILKEVVSTLPKSSETIKFRFSTRLVLGIKQNVKPQFQHGLANALQLHVDRINTTDTPEALAAILNKKVEDDSGGAMHDTFEEDELSEGICAVLLTTMYLRARWRSAPTVLNGTHVFHDDMGAPLRSARMIRINDIMRYAELNEWDAEAVEIFYATPGLSLLILIPRGRSLRNLAAHLTDTSIHRVLEQMYTLRVAVTLPLYTLRMTLLVPNKLQSWSEILYDGKMETSFLPGSVFSKAILSTTSDTPQPHLPSARGYFMEIGITRLVDVEQGECEELRLSHAVQRLMFWAEAGLNAFKDDGIEWDEAPELELVINRPYIFFVRWRNMTVMNGNFVL